MLPKIQIQTPLTRGLCLPLFSPQTAGRLCTTVAYCPRPPPLSRLQILRHFCQTARPPVTSYSLTGLQLHQPGLGFWRHLKK